MNVMPLWLQNILVFLIVGLCLGAVVYQAAQSLRGRKSRLGSCCAKGCTPLPTSAKPTQKVQFIPVEMLSRKH